MQGYRLAGLSLGVVAFALASFVTVDAQRGGGGGGGGQDQQTMQPPVAPAVSPRLAGAPSPTMGGILTPALEGWYRNADGTVTFLVGYFNRNASQTFDIPVGPNNRIEPGGPDYGQPTFFGLQRAYGVFTITVPKDFGTKRLTWTLVANGQAQAITLWINEPYVVGPFFRGDSGNSPPMVKLTPTSPEVQGPPRGFLQTLTTTVTNPITIAFVTGDRGNTVNQQDQNAPARPTTFGNAPAAGAPAAAGGGAAAAPAGGDAGGTAAPGATADGAARGAGGGGGRAGAGGGGGRGGGGRGGGGAAAGAAGAAADAGAAQAGRGAAGGAGGGGARGGGPGGGGGAGAGAGGGGGGGGRGGGGAITVSLHKHRGPGIITFADRAPMVVADTTLAKAFSKPVDFAGRVSTTATFSAPGEYVIRAQVNDSTGNGGGGDQCCWTNVHYKVTVR